MINKGICDRAFNWNPSICDCECDKSCDIGQYLDYKNCKCRKGLIRKLVEVCNENIGGNEMTYNDALNDYGKACNYCTIYIVLFDCVFNNH